MKADQTLDLNRLEKVRHHPAGKITARCPACAEEDRDRTGNHLAIFPTGKFSCIAIPEDSDHRRRIFTLVGIKTDPPRRNPEEARRWKQKHDERRRREHTQARITETARKQRADLVTNYRWHPADLWEDSPTRPNDAADDPRIFLASLFPPSAIVWTGKVFDSGERYRNRWRSVCDWFDSPLEELGPMTTPATWKPETVSRSQGAIASAPFVVLDFDGQEGRKPATAPELERHLSESLALVRWLKDRLRWRLAAILSTGGKSIHAWFEDPGPACLESLRPTFAPFGIDGGLIGHPEHPCRLPGQIHSATGKRSRVLWLR